MTTLAELTAAASGLTDGPAWQALDAHRQAIDDLHLQTLLEALIAEAGTIRPSGNKWFKEVFKHRLGKPGTGVLDPYFNPAAIGLHVEPQLDQNLSLPIHSTYGIFD